MDARLQYGQLNMKYQNWPIVLCTVYEVYHAVSLDYHSQNDAPWYGVVRNIVSPVSSVHTSVAAPPPKLTG